MYEYNPQPFQPERDVEPAKKWYNEHKEHVEKLVAQLGPGYPPSGSDCVKPELWKEDHWKWFLTKYCG